MANLFRKGGIPALASSLFDHTSPCPGTLIILVNERARQATIELQFELPVRGFDSDQRISLVYDGDTFEPGTTTVSDAPASAAQLAQVARPRGGKLKSLGLVLTQPCVVLSPSPGNLCAKDAFDPRFEQLAALAKATRLDILFDYYWLHPDKTAQFECLAGSSGLTGFPRLSAETAREADWTIFSPGEAPPCSAPPLYEEESSKRPRRSPLGSPQAPRPKRLLLDTGVYVDPGSPTEKATTIAPSSPPVDPLDPLQAATEAAMAKLLPSALRDVLPEVLSDVLPGILKHMFTVPTSTPPPQATPPPNPMSPLHRAIRAQLNDCAEKVAEQIAVDNYAHALEVRETADLVLEEHLEEHRLELAVVKEDGLMEIHRVYDTKLEQLEERTRELVETVELETSEAYTTAKEKLDEYMGEQRMELVKERLSIAQRRRSGSLATEEGARRANSVPLDMGW
ncbi:hypothetical protein P171DRAFT_179969 [Karstenula rhodostoma CBS 690.94]|uniref:Uncharacterized protein n=1 Tax=Karstenula rhodostoma CBS 690.94 TaxID=1392251 RepID=A0A9P4U556_9PLEO|nr:hypothetical protein P171DRAFT_179969 [Karstenula rhodostoma CBS 690.94]